MWVTSRTTHVNHFSYNVQHRWVTSRTTHVNHFTYNTCESLHVQHICRVGQNRIYTPYMTVYLMISLPKIPYIHRIYMVLANPTHLSHFTIAATLLLVRQRGAFVTSNLCTHTVCRMCALHVFKHTGGLRIHFFNAVPAASMERDTEKKRMHVLTSQKLRGFDDVHLLGWPKLYGVYACGTIY